MTTKQFHNVISEQNKWKRNRHKWTERNRKNREEQIPTETDINKNKLRQTDRKQKKQKEISRNGQKRIETERIGD